MNIERYLLISLIIFLIISCKKDDNQHSQLNNKYPEIISFSVNNPTEYPRNDCTLYLDIQDLKSGHRTFNVKAFIIMSGDEELPSQTIDFDDDGKLDAIMVNFDLTANEGKDLSVRFNPVGEILGKYTKRTQAELSHKVGGKFVDRKYIGGVFENVSYLKLPPEHTDHSFYIRYEGPGWESDKVGYRFYLDWRNATDIFGKKIHDMVLQDVGQDGFDSYHQPADWGMDILKVGESLGIGSIAMWEDGKANRVAETDSVDCKIVANGSLYSQIRTRYFGWKIGAGEYDLISDLSITAGSRMTKHRLGITGNAQNLCSGLAKFEGTDYFQSNMDQGGWAYMALYGKQSLAGDNLGTAVLFDTKQLIEINEDEINHVVVLRPYQDQVTYYFTVAWEQEPGGIKSKQEFKDYLDQKLTELNMPLLVTYE